MLALVRLRPCWSSHIQKRGIRVPRRTEVKLAYKSSLLPSSKQISVPQSLLPSHRLFHATQPAQIWPLVVGVGVAALAMGAKVVMNTANNPKVQEAFGRATQSERETPSSQQAATQSSPASKFAAGTRVIGIDLGMADACVAMMEAGKPKVMENREGQRSTPSVVSFQDDGEVLIGTLAKKHLYARNSSTIPYAHQLLGRDYYDPVTQQAKEELSYNIVQNEDGLASIEVRGIQHSTGDLTSLLLEDLKQSAEHAMGALVDGAVIAVPAGSAEEWRDTMQQSAEAVGLSPCLLVEEPLASVAAAQAEFGEDAVGDTVVVFDLGGCNFHASVVKQGNLGYEVVATQSAAFLGGSQFDSAIIRYLVEDFREQQKIDLSNDHLAMQRLHEVAEKAKRELSTAMTTQINLPFITADMNGPKHLDTSLTRAKLEQLVDPLLDGTLPLCSAVLNEAGIDSPGVDSVLLVGGMARMPRVGEVAQGFFGKVPLRPAAPEESVATGASLYSARLLEAYA